MDIDIKSFKELDIYTKVTTLSILIIMPFWYCSFYLFNKPFFTSSDQYIKIVFAFCLSAVWLIGSSILAFLNNTLERKEFALAYPSVFKSATITAIVAIAVSIYTEYLYPHSYLYFLNRSYVYLTLSHVFRIPIILLTRATQRKKSSADNLSAVSEDSAI